MQQLVTPNDVDPQTNHYKTIFLSDIHLGSRACQADLLLDFLKYNDSEKMYRRRKNAGSVVVPFGVLRKARYLKS